MAGKHGLDSRFLANSSLLTGLEQGQVDELVELARVVRLDDGQAAVEQGTVGESIFLLHSGAIAVTTHDGGGGEVVLAVLAEPGSFFGEMALVDPGPRSATVRAQGRAVLLELSLEALERYFARHPEARVVILRNIARVLARRLRDANVRVASARTM
ncbi:MAG: cyclic nucleotide-binding domain-containing protein [Candidatus Latescibacterota bacterium]